MQETHIGNSGSDTQRQYTSPPSVTGNWRRRSGSCAFNPKHMPQDTSSYAGNRSIRNVWFTFDLCLSQITECRGPTKELVHQVCRQAEGECLKFRELSCMLGTSIKFTPRFNDCSKLGEAVQGHTIVSLVYVLNTVALHLCSENPVATGRYAAVGRHSYESTLDNERHTNRARTGGRSHQTFLLKTIFAFWLLIGWGLAGLGCGGIDACLS